MAVFMLRIKNMFFEEKYTLLVLCGGKSSEHEVSMRSAKNVLAAIDREIFWKVHVIYIDKKGAWFLVNEDFVKEFPRKYPGEPVMIVPGGAAGAFILKQDQDTQIDSHIDVVFPVMHGTNCEDGTLQGLFEQINIPYVGCDVISSANCFDKEITKQLLRAAGIKVAHSQTLLNKNQADYTTISNELGDIFFVKPACQGSSVGVHKVTSEKEFKYALKDAFSYDTKVLCEKFIAGKEIEVSVLGETNNPKVSVPGAIIPQAEFYSYDAKYIDEDGAKMQIPAELSSAKINEVQEIAKKAYAALGCYGMARVDFFLTDSGEFILNEINTLPGFTSISMYPKLWEESGLSYSDLITELCKLALQRHKHKK